MKRVYLIRHAQPEFPGGKRMCLGITDLPLSAEGQVQAKAMAAALPSVTAVWSSPLVRAVQTAEAIGLPVRILEDLRELNAGEWDGLTFEKIRELYPELYAARRDNRNLPPPGAEDFAAGTARFRQAMDQAARESEGNLAVIAHGGIIARFLESVNGIWRKPGYAEVVPLLWNNGEFYVQEEENHA